MSSRNARAMHRSDLGSAFERHSSLIELGRMLRAEREKHGLTPGQFAEALGVPSAEVVRIERGVTAAR